MEEQAFSIILVPTFRLRPRYKPRGCIRPKSASRKSCTDRSFRVALCKAAILPSRINQLAHRSWPDAPSTVEASDFESDSPLLEQHTVGVEQAELRIVDMGSF